MKRRPITEAKRVRVREALTVRRHSAAEIAAIVDVRLETARRHLAALREQKQIHIIEWADRRTPLFALTLPGFKNTEAKKPKPLTAAQRMAKSRAKKEKS